MQRAQRSARDSSFHPPHRLLLPLLPHHSLTASSPPLLHQQGNSESTKTLIKTGGKYMAAHLGVADANAAIDNLKINVLNHCSGWNDPILRDYLKDHVYQKFFDNKKIDDEKAEIKDGHVKAVDT